MKKFIGVVDENYNDTIIVFRRTLYFQLNLLNNLYFISITQMTLIIIEATLNITYKNLLNHVLEFYGTHTYSLNEPKTLI